MLSEQAVQINLPGVQMITGEVVRMAMMEYVYSVRQKHAQPKTPHGEQSLEDLNAQNRQLDHRDFEQITDRDVQSIRRELNRYAVDFHIRQDPETGTYSLFFKAQDTDRVEMAMKKCLERFGRTPMAEQMRDATKEAAERNAAHEAQKAAEQTVEQAAEQAVKKAAEKAAEAVL